MKRVFDIIKPVVRDLKPYSLRPDRASIKINQNENPWDAPARIKEETLRRMTQRQWSRYPDFVPQELQEKLAEFAGWTSRGIIAGNGSNELIQALLMVTLAVSLLRLGSVSFSAVLVAVFVSEPEVVTVAVRANVTEAPLPIAPMFQTPVPLV